MAEKQLLVNIFRYQLNSECGQPEEKTHFPVSGRQECERHEHAHRHAEQIDVPQSVDHIEYIHQRLRESRRQKRITAVVPVIFAEQERVVDFQDEQRPEGGSRDCGGSPEPFPLLRHQPEPRRGDRNHEVLLDQRRECEEQKEIRHAFPAVTVKCREEEEREQAFGVEVVQRQPRIIGVEEVHRREQQRNRTRPEITFRGPVQQRGGKCERRRLDQRQPDRGVPKQIERGEQHHHRRKVVEPAAVIQHQAVAGGGVAEHGVVDAEVPVAHLHRFDLVKAEDEITQKKQQNHPAQKQRFALCRQGEAGARCAPARCGGRYCDEEDITQIKHGLHSPAAWR